MRIRHAKRLYRQETDERSPLNWTLEVIAVPVTDVERAKAFYAEQLGFAVDHDTTVDASTRFVQLTPPGSGCSIVIGTGGLAPGSLQGVQSSRSPPGPECAWLAG